VGATPVTITVTTITTTTITTITAIWNHLDPSLYSALKRENPDPRSKTAPPARVSGNYCQGAVLERWRHRHHRISRHGHEFVH